MQVTDIVRHNQRHSQANALRGQERVLAMRRSSASCLCQAWQRDPSQASTPTAKKLNCAPMRNRSAGLRITTKIPPAPKQLKAEAGRPTSKAKQTSSTMMSDRRADGGEPVSSTYTVAD